MIVLRFKLVLAALLLVGAASAQEHALKRVPKQDESIRYKIRAELSFGEVLAVMTGTTMEKITKIEADGSFLVESSSIEAKVEMESLTYDVGKQPPMVKTLAPMGEVTAIKGANIDSSV